jgi:hypothetical protein
MADCVSVHKSAELWREEVLTELLNLEDLVVANPNTKKEMKSGIAKLAGLLRKLTVRSTTEVGTAPENFQVPNSQTSKFLERDTVRASPRLVVSRDTTILVCGGATVTLKQESKPVSGQQRVGPGPSTSQEEEDTSTAEWRTVKRKRHNKKQQQETQPTTAPERTSGTSTIIIRKNGKSYADILKDLKEKDSLGNETEIVSIRKGNAGQVEIRAKDPEKKLLTNLKKLKDAEVLEKQGRTGAEKKHLIISGMDALVDEQQVKEAIKKVAGCKEGEIQVTSLRPAFAETQKATIVVSEEMANKILVASPIKIGWVSCKVVARKTIIRCFKCWGEGHMSRNCKGPERNGLCFRCGEDGHKIRDCPNDKKCLDCSNTGHRTGMCERTKRCSRE